MEAQSLGSIGDVDALGQINGVVQVLLTDLGASPLLIPPATLKKFVTGSGQASKAQMAAATYNLWGEEIQQDDLCDAYGLARMAEEYVENKSTRRHQIEAIRSLTKKKTRTRIKKILPKTL
jgi:Holliday junction resolvasome RuvABC endonuclease subunit